MPLVCVNGVVPPALTFAALRRELAARAPARAVIMHDLVGYAERLPGGYGTELELAALADTVRAAHTHGPDPADPAGPADPADPVEPAGPVEPVGPAGRVGRLRPVHLLGYSAGASVALVYAVTSPDRVASLTLCEPPWLGRPDHSAFQTGMDEIMLRTPAPQRWERFHQLLTRPGTGVPPPPPDPPSWAPLRVARGGDVWAALRDTMLPPGAVRAFTGPVYLPVAADSHPWFTDAAHELAGLFPDATVEVYPASHVRPPHVCDPTRFVTALHRLWLRAGDDGTAGTGSC